MNETIVLIGPMRAGKSTIGQLIADKLDRPSCSMDELRWEYYEEIGYDAAEAERALKSEQGIWGILRYWKPFEAHAVERILGDYPDHVIDFGAGHSVYEDEALFARVQHLLVPCNVILLLPCPDLAVSVEVLNARLSAEGEQVDGTLLAVNEHFVRHTSNFQLATMVVYTEGKTPGATCEEIVGRI